MIAGWREDFNEGPYDYLAVRDGWEIFCADENTKNYRVRGPDGQEAHRASTAEAKEFAYDNGCSRPVCDTGD